MCEMIFLRSFLDLHLRLLLHAYDLYGMEVCFHLRERNLVEILFTFSEIFRHLFLYGQWSATIKQVADAWKFLRPSESYVKYTWMI